MNNSANFSTGPYNEQIPKAINEHGAHLATNERFDAMSFFDRSTFGGGISSIEEKRTLTAEIPKNRSLSKRQRTCFTPYQLNRLEKEYECNVYVVGLKRMSLASQLNLPEKQVKVWFQNRRMKSKRDRLGSHGQAKNSSRPSGESSKAVPINKEDTGEIWEPEKSTGYFG